MLPSKFVGTFFLFLAEPQRHEDNHGKAIFIDAICIDQENLAERNAQVKLMGKIYSEAACVYVWLGPHTDGSERALGIWRIIEQYRGNALPSTISDLVANEIRKRVIYELKQRYPHTRHPDKLFWNETCAISQRSF